MFTIFNSRNLKELIIEEKRKENDFHLLNFRLNPKRRVVSKRRDF